MIEIEGLNEKEVHEKLSNAAIPKSELIMSTRGIMK